MSRFVNEVANYRTLQVQTVPPNREEIISVINKLEARPKKTITTPTTFVQNEQQEKNPFWSRLSTLRSPPKPNAVKSNVRSFAAKGEGVHKKSNPAEAHSTSSSVNFD